MPVANLTSLAADATLVGILAQLLEGRWSNFPARHIDHPQKCCIVVRIHQKAQIGQDVLDFGIGENDWPPLMK